MNRRMLKLATTGCIAYAALFWSMHKSVPLIGFGRTFDGKDIYSFAGLTLGTYCWAGVAVLSFCVLVTAAVLFLISLSRHDESKRHGFPVR